ncbi:hypothetical protein RhiirC2_794427 [Rhizophagus irregularis]|uniref:Crinkler family protein n=1 Tax=Rhizophagus irregularis TaxID=588596 RepID=A0A2N1MDJ9_9GLOM|nr:hypothetical protein RhiirC2_794427 [Rhizophagus irregularis]
MELMNKIAELERLLRKPIYGIQWVANIDQVTLGDSRESIFAMHQLPELEKDSATFTFECNGYKYSPQSDLELRNILQLFVAKSSLKFTVFIETSLSFSLWTFPKPLQVRPEKNVSGPNGHGPVDFALVLVRTSRIIGITEVKDKDFLQGIAQNSVQCESAALSNYKKKSLCSLDDEVKPEFKLSKPVVIVYGDEDMEYRVKRSLVILLILRGCWKRHKGWM